MNVSNKINQVILVKLPPILSFQKVERRLCAEAEMLEFLEKVYGPTF